jgi:hypothetical protein
MLIEESGAGSGSISIPLTSGSGSGRPKNMWIRIRNTVLYPDDSCVQMVSCGADKSIIFRDVNTEDSAGITLSRVNHIVGKTTLYDMELDRCNLRYKTIMMFLHCCGSVTFGVDPGHSGVDPDPRIHASDGSGSFCFHY